MKTPVLLITFNRPDYTKQMIEALRAAEVENLYVFKDGPRPNNQNDLVASKEIEKLIKAIDWECNVKTLFLNNNLGCGYGPYTAISWAFGSEEELIILEDDCIPTKPFFSFCTEMLERYKDNKSVRHISGRSYLPDHHAFKNSDYIFSQYAPTWGWATWKRVWTNFDMQMRELTPFFKDGGYSNQFATAEEATFFNKRYRATRKDKSIVYHIWDFQYGLHSRANDSLAIVPSKNLIHYIGVEGTHPVGVNSSHTQMNVDNEFKVIEHPKTVKFNEDYEYEYYKKFINPDVSLYKKIGRWIKKQMK